MRRLVIVGAGAMGCLFAARLAETGRQVVLVDLKEERLQLLRRDGIVLDDDAGERRVPVDAALAADVAGPVDLVILFTKGMHSAAAVRSVAHLADGRALALTLQNGVGNAEHLAAAFGPANTLMGITDLPADLTGPNSVHSHGIAHVRLGGFSEAADDHAPAVVEMLARAGWQAAHDAAIGTAIWEKLAFNAAMNAMSAVTGLTVGQMDHPPGHRIAAAIVAEVVAVAAARGLLLDKAGIEARIANGLAHHRGHKPSMLQDRLAGRPSEIETIHGAVEREGRAHGVPTPVTSALADLVRLIEANAAR